MYKFLLFRNLGLCKGVGKVGMFSVFVSILRSVLVRVFVVSRVLDVVVVNFVFVKVFCMFELFDCFIQVVFEVVFVVIGWFLVE